MAGTWAGCATDEDVAGGFEAEDVGFCCEELGASAGGVRGCVDEPDGPAGADVDGRGEAMVNSEWDRSDINGLR